MFKECVIGCWVRDLDEKSRVALPSVAVEALNPGPKRLLMIGRLPGQVLAVYSPRVYQSLVAEAVEEGSSEIGRYFFANFLAVTLNAETHRIQIPYALRVYSGLRGGSRATVLGAGSGLRLMTMETWVKEQEEFERIAQEPGFPLSRGIDYHPYWRQIAYRARPGSQKAA